MDRVETLAQRGLSKAQIAAALGIGDATLRRHQRWDLEFKAAIERGRARGIVALANAGYDLAIIEKDGPMIRYLLSCVGGFRETSRLEVTGEDGAPVRIKGDIHHTVDVLARVAHLELVLATDGARTHAKEELETAERQRLAAGPTKEEDQER